MITPVGPEVPDLRIPRWYPCVAFSGQDIRCGATPSALYRRYCLVPSHTAEIWLCPIHAMLCNSGLVLCKMCADRGGVSKVRVDRLSPEVRLP